ncbi:MAG TPA: hypothetical protein DEA08_15295 [Planctomycetes bacterium]|nr:hypothetical protein [Planctomycetota bacterium]
MDPVLLLAPRVLTVDCSPDLVSALEFAGNDVQPLACHRLTRQRTSNARLIVFDLIWRLDEAALSRISMIRDGSPPWRLAIVVLLPADSDEEAYRAAFAAGASDVLVRTRPLRYLCTKLARWTNEIGAQEEALPLAEGDQLGPFRVEIPLGEGAYSRVVAARSAAGDEAAEQDTFALKVFDSVEQTSLEQRLRVLREAYILSALSCPHVVRFHGLMRESGALYAVLERVEGRTLLDATEGQPQSEEQVRQLLRGLARALAALEERGIVHRDLKPSNVVLRGEDWRQPVLVDFGLAKQCLERGVTRPGLILGTLGYIAPEVLRGESEYDTRSDLFALGVVALFALRGRDPFPDLGQGDLVRWMSERELEVPAWVSPQLRALIKDLVSPFPERRPASALDLLERLPQRPSSRSYRTSRLEPETRSSSRLTAPPLHKDVA